MIERVKKSLKRVRCFHTINYLDTSLKYAQDNELSYLSFLDYLLAKECSYRDQTAIDRNLRKADLPFIKTFDNFDFSYQHAISKRLVAEWETFCWLDKRENKIFMGPPGVGKTHLSAAIGYSAIKQGYRVKFYTMNNLVDEMLLASYDEKFKNWLKQVSKNDLLIIDEIGYLPVKPVVANLFFQLINEMYEFRSIIITSNKLFQEWGSAFGDNVITTAILDRLLHHAEAIVIEGDSYRLKGKIK